MPPPPHPSTVAQPQSASAEAHRRRQYLHNRVDAVLDTTSPTAFIRVAADILVGLSVLAKRRGVDWRRVTAHANTMKRYRAHPSRTATRQRTETPATAPTPDSTAAGTP
ncbi:hypothetical protein ACIRL2_46870 [Embleya sp. NPDC127516]|uniref:hypothetical protein n=1 Tax=Embleya sp. NPDC127516 TaxID=3363990 RepID=UPI00382DB738